MGALTSLAVATRRAGDLFNDVLPWCLALIAAVLVGTVLVSLVRRRLRDSGSGPQEGFTLQDLREMRRAGLISDEEFQRTREQVIGRLRGPAEPPAEPTPDPPADPPADPTTGNSADRDT
jgi:hypothetical protein